MLATERSPESSLTTMTEIVLPVHANAHGNIFGGQVMAWMDVCGAICAQRHARAIAVTAGVDELHFARPLKVGQVLRAEARVTAAFTSSLEVEVSVYGEEPSTGETWLCVSAFMTFVAIDPAGKPQQVPKLLLVTEHDRTLATAAAERRARRISRRV